MGEQVIDLEGLANHKGSAFGALGQEQQPTTEHFMNLLHDAVSACDPGRPIWVESESKTIGRVFLPDDFYKVMRHNHKGSAFGALGQEQQPTTEHFMNLLHDAVSACDPGRPIWVESESKTIGRVFLPDDFYKVMRQAPLIELSVPRPEWGNR